MYSMTYFLFLDKEMQIRNTRLSESLLRGGYDSDLRTSDTQFERHSRRDDTRIFFSLFFGQKLQPSDRAPDRPS